MDQRSRTVVVLVLFAAMAAILLVGLSASAHAATAPANQHGGATSASATPSYTNLVVARGNGACQRCIYAHPYEAEVLGLG